MAKQTITEWAASVTHKDLQKISEFLGRQLVSEFRNDDEALATHRVLAAVNFQIALEQGATDE